MKRWVFVAVQIAVAVLFTTAISYVSGKPWESIAVYYFIGAWWVLIIDKAGRI